jgi:hypothetical protein
MVSAARFVRIGSGASLNEDGSPRKGLPGLGAGDAGPDRALSRRLLRPTRRAVAVASAQRSGQYPAMGRVSRPALRDPSRLCDRPAQAA